MTAEGVRRQVLALNACEAMIQNYGQKKLQRGDRWIDKMLLLFKSGKIFSCAFQSEATFKFLWTQ